MPRLGLAALSGVPPPGHRVAFCLGLPDSADVRPEVARRPVGPRGRLHRPARLDRDLPAGAGWVGLDPTSGLFAGEGHIPLACTPQPTSAAPISGAHDPCEVEFDFEMSIKRVHEDPRVTKPYTEAQWERIEALGHEVDEHLQRNDVRLTMGGEPTFVSIDDMDGDEWQTAAVGPNKRRLGNDLLLRLTRRFGRGACCTTGKASGTRARRCPAGPCTATGGKTASRSGATKPCWPPTAPRTATPPRMLSTLPARWPRTWE